MSLAGREAGVLDGAGEVFEALFVGGKVRPDPAFVGDAVQFSLFDHGLGGSHVDFGDLFGGLGERGGTDREDQEVLDVDAVAGMAAAAEDLDHRSGDVIVRRRRAPRAP